MNDVNHQAAFARIDRVVARLQQAVLDNADLPGLAELASVACLSPFHFHRIYRAMTGETIGRTAMRLRMVRALHLLGDPDVSVTHIALASGYDTSQAFARAFRDVTGGTPSDLRGQPAQRAAEIARLSHPRGRCDDDRTGLVVNVVSVEPFEVVALRKTGAFADLNQAYDALFGWAALAGVVDRVSGLFGIPLGDHRDLPAAQLLFDCAVRIDAVVAPPEPLRVLQIDGGYFAVARHIGPYERIEDQVDRMLTDWLPASGLALRDTPIHYHYLDDPEQVPEALLRADIHLPVRTAH
jgi:AraC family transcriptional regulator